MLLFSHPVPIYVLYFILFPFSAKCPKLPLVGKTVVVVAFFLACDVRRFILRTILAMIGPQWLSELGRLWASVT